MPPTIVIPEETNIREVNKGIYKDIARDNTSNDNKLVIDKEDNVQLETDEVLEEIGIGQGG